MKKIAIVTIISDNYGNRLQNYALQEYLKENFSVKVASFLSRGTSRRKFLVKNSIKKILMPYFPNKTWKFAEFNQRITWSKFNDGTANVDKKYDYFIAGSDQIWNPLFDFNSEREFLTFAKPNQRIAYAASIGLSDLSDNYKAIYNKRLNQFDKISMREVAGARIIEQINCKLPPVVLDPSMLLTKEKWNTIALESKIKPAKKYILFYSFGSIPNAYMAQLNLYAKKIDSEIIDLGILDNGMVDTKVGPIEFVYLIQHAEFVFTNSFHGTAFSILFNKEFFVFEREITDGTGDMSSRLDTILGTFELESRRVKSAEYLDFTQHIDYARVNSLLDIERERSYQFLKNAIEE